MSLSDTGGGQPSTGRPRVEDDSDHAEHFFFLRYRLVLFLDKESPAWGWVPLSVVKRAFDGVPLGVLARTLAKMERDGLVALADGDEPAARLLRKL